VLIGLILVPGVLWVSVVLVAPTDWARRRVIAALEARSGRSVALQRVSVQLLGGVSVTDLQIGSPQTIDDPWLRTGSIRLDFRLLQLLSGNLQPSAVAVEGVSLRVLRRADGSLELADLIQASPRTPQQSGRKQQLTDRIVVGFRRAEVTLIDEPSRTRLHLKNVEGEGSRDGDQFILHEMHGTLNGGAFRLAGRLLRTVDGPFVKAQVRAEDVVIDDGMSLLRYAVPVLAGASLNWRGHLNSDLYIEGQGKTWDAVSRSLAGHGLVVLDPIDLDGAPLVAELSKIAELSRQGGGASIRSDFEIMDRRITTDHFALKIGRVPMSLSGWTDFDGRIDYRINLAGLNDRLPEKARRILGELSVDLKSLQVLTLQGTVNKLVVRLNGISLDRDVLHEAKLKREDREKLRVLGRKLLDDLVR
jgi:AsmA protein